MRTSIVIILLLLAAAASVAFAIGRRDELERRAAGIAHGDPRRGRADVVQFGCVACHVVPGMHGTDPRVGPPLAEMALRVYVAGVVENTPENLEHFLQDPRAIAPRSAMPKLGLGDREARDIAAFLYTLQ